MSMMLRMSLIAVRLEILEKYMRKWFAQRRKRHCCIHFAVQSLRRLRTRLPEKHGVSAESAFFFSENKLYDDLQF